MNMAYKRSARQIWIVNVGDLKPLEIPISHFFDLAYDMPKWSAPDSIDDWLKMWATREFGAEVANDTADVVNTYSMYEARRKYESLNSTHYSLINYNEADTVLNDWKTLVDKAQEIYNGLSSPAQPAFFELVLHPCLAGYTVYDIHNSAGKSLLYANQRRQTRWPKPLWMPS
jgi:hypothetical protein